jgi:hypothetical protein
MRVDQTGVGAMMVNHRNPFPDNRFQLVQVEERLRLRIQPTRMNIRALVTQRESLLPNEFRPEDLLSTRPASPILR